MSADEDTDLPGGWEAEAAEYVLGLLPDAEARAFEGRLARDPDLQQDVDAWTAFFVSLTDSMPEETPPPAVLRSVEATVWGAPPPPVWQQVLPYLLGAVAGAALAFVVFVSGVLTPQADLIYARLEPVSASLAFDVQIDPPTHTINVELIAGTVPDGRSLQLWLIPVDAEPISLGVMSASGNHVVVLSDSMADRVPGGTLAVSDEPPGGSPSGGPTGDVQAAGVVIPIEG